MYKDNNLHSNIELCVKCVSYIKQIVICRIVKVIAIISEEENTKQNNIEFKAKVQGTKGMRNNKTYAFLFSVFS